MSREEWLKERKKGIGSSDAPALHHKSPYLTEYECYMDKVSPTLEEKTGYIMEKGNTYEPKIRALFETDWNLGHTVKTTFAPKNVSLPDFPFIKASLDGISACGKYIIEAKFVGKEVYDSGLVPDNYYIQIQHQLLASGAEEAYFACTTNGEEIRHIRILPDEKFMTFHLVKCQIFWERVMSKNPPPLSDNDFKEIKGHDILVAKYIACKREQNEVEERLNDLKEKIISILDHPKMFKGAFKIQKVVSRGNINYKEVLKEESIAEAIEENGIDLESFRAEDKVFYKISTGEKSN